MKNKECVIWKSTSVVLIFIMIFSAFSIVLATPESHSGSRTSRTVSELKLVVNIGDWDNQHDNPDINITTRDQSDNYISYVNIFGTNVPEFSQTNETGEFILWDQPAGQYKIMADYYNGFDQLFDDEEFLLRSPSGIFLYADLGIGPFDDDFDGNGSPDDIEIQFFKAFDMNPNNDTNVTNSEVKIWHNWQDPQYDPPEIKRKTDNNGKIFLKNLEMDMYKLQISNSSYYLKYEFNIFYDFHMNYDFVRCEGTVKGLLNVCRHIFKSQIII